jgi:hypothetical protein
MPISLILPASLIPADMEVFKTGGAKPYILKTGIRLFTQGEKGSTAITPSPGMVYLVGRPDADINQVPADTPLRIDFQDVTEAADFLRELQTEEEDK